MTISIYRYGHTAALALEGWDPNLIHGEGYDSPRGRALYAALDVAPDDEYALAQNQRDAVEDSSST